MPPPLSKAKSLAVDDKPAVYVQSVWRGVCARREFSDRFVAAVEAALGPEAGIQPSTSPHNFDDSVKGYDDEQSPLRTPQGVQKRGSISIEEAQEDASYNPYATNQLIHVSSASGRAKSWERVCKAVGGIDKQKVELSTLVARRDELRRERDLRRATADTLVEQINASVFVKEERRREAMRS